MVPEQNVTLGDDTVVMVWISSQDAAAVAEKGFRIVHGPSDYFYLVRTKISICKLQRANHVFDRTVEAANGSGMTSGMPPHA